MEYHTAPGSNPKEVAIQVISEIVEQRLSPILITTTGSFDLSPQAVRNLNIEDVGISFVATFSGKVGKEAFLWDDIIAIEAGEDLK